VTFRLRLIDGGPQLEQDLPWRRPDNADLRIDLSRGREAAPRGPNVKPGPHGRWAVRVTDAQHPVRRRAIRRGCLVSSRWRELFRAVRVVRLPAVSLRARPRHQGAVGSDLV
jgi:hypothetical protein